LGAQTVQLGRYQLMEPIGRGGMAEAWLAKLVGAFNFERVVVIKRILPHLCTDREFVRMFVAEARMCARLHHANIVQVFELGDCDGQLFMALEYVDGVDLARLMTATRAPMPPGLCALAAYEICRALAYAQSVTNERGRRLSIVHRDISPSNIMLGYDGQVRLLDFGIAKALGAVSDVRSVMGNLKGKLGYMPPEIFDDKPFTHRSDLFAVGVLMHELLTGQRLFVAPDRVQTIQLLRACHVAPPSHHRRGVPAALDRVAMRALARRPEDRFADAEEMMAALERIVHQQRWSARATAAVLQRRAPPAQMPDPTLVEPTSALRRALAGAAAVAQNMAQTLTMRRRR
jgi:serine/threonine protein kinase